MLKPSRERVLAHGIVTRLPEYQPTDPLTAEAAVRAEGLSLSPPQSREMGVGDTYRGTSTHTSFDDVKNTYQVFMPKKVCTESNILSFNF